MRVYSLAWFVSTVHWTVTAQCTLSVQVYPGSMKGSPFWIVITDAGALSVRVGFVLSTT